MTREREEEELDDFQCFNPNLLNQKGKLLSP